jgi:low affinity Fe/Cu permease
MPQRPTDMRDRRTRFDHLAERASAVVGQAAFFTASLLAVIAWIPTILIFSSVDTWQLVISTITSVLAFLLVALLQNSARRNDVALQRKLDALTEAVIVVLANTSTEEDDELRRHVEQLRAAVGLEEQI